MNAATTEVERFTPTYCSYTFTSVLMIIYYRFKSAIDKADEQYRYYPAHRHKILLLTFC